jgi:BspA type Leucine rich repeat region (6 copies)
MKPTARFVFRLLLCLMPTATQAQSYYTNSFGVFSYTTTNGAVTITHFQGAGDIFTGSNVNVTIPSSINNLPVTAIGQSAFTGDYMNLGSIIIPGSVTSIGEDAFTSCTYLTNALIGGGVTNIGAYAFQDDRAMTNIYFLGNAPAATNNQVFASDIYTTVYYLPFNSGWSNTYIGQPTAAWNPQLPALGVSTYTKQPVLFYALPAAFPASIGTNFVLQMTTNLASSNWVTITDAIPIVCVQITNPLNPAYFRLQPH